MCNQDHPQAGPDSSSTTARELAAPRAFGRRTLFGAAAVGGVAMASSVTAAHFMAPTAAAVTAPQVHSTGDWGAEPPRQTLQTLYYRPTYIAIHHTTYPNTTDHSLSQAYARARQIQRDHFARNFGDSGQQFTISQGGHVLEGRHGSLAAVRNGSRFILGAHAAGHNSEAVGIENDGLYTAALPSEPQWKSIVTFVAYLCQQYRVPVSKIVGHRQLSATECPGDLFYANLATLREHVQIVLDGGPVSPPPDGGTPPGDENSWSILKSGSRGFRVSSLQHLLRQRGHTLAVDGTFGPQTDGAVRAFQDWADLVVDGVVGPKTWPKVVLTARQGDAGHHVRGVQVGLGGRGHATTVDGQFGPGTRAQVEAFQDSRDLVVDGVVGPITWSSLMARG
ncbi:peptidoglycan recognition protein family protein [Microlunatus sp. Y2014]|uniref:peptidoglycan recognition protein family protein n=1 Tax=Microlunatus sp. Y2014 TaxID=3418488 RepID=UPI003DA71097